MYKHDDVSPMDAVFGAADLGDLVTQLTMVRTIARCDRDVVRTIETTKRELTDRAVRRSPPTSARRRSSSARCKSELATIRARLDERRAALAGVRSDIRRLVADAAKASPIPTPTVEPPAAGGRRRRRRARGGRSSRARRPSNGVSARGMYRLMMIESGGSATVVGPGRLLRPLPVRAHHLEGQLEPVAVVEHHRRRGADQGHGARHPPGLRPRLVGPLLHLGLPGRLSCAALGRWRRPTVHRCTPTVVPRSYRRRRPAPASARSGLTARQHPLDFVRFARKCSDSHDAGHWNGPRRPCRHGERPGAVGCEQWEPPAQEAR